MKKFKINGQEFESKELDMNFFCDVTDKFGISAERFLSDEMSMIRIYVAMCGDISLSEAGKLLEQHIISGKTLENVGKIMAEEIDNSGFIKAIAAKREQVATQNESEEKK